MPHTDTMSREMHECIARCTECEAVCLETLQHCLQQGGRHAASEHITRLLACADICRTSATFMRLGSDLHGRTCAVCAEVCMRCAEDCERFADDDMMKACADACRRCAESCQQMAHAMSA